MSIKLAKDVSDLQGFVAQMRKELQALQDQVERIETVIAHMNEPKEGKRKNARAN